MAGNPGFLPRSKCLKTPDKCYLSLYKFGLLLWNKFIWALSSNVQEADYNKPDEGCKPVGGLAALQSCFWVFIKSKNNLWNIHPERFGRISEELFEYTWSSSAKEEVNHILNSIVILSVEVFMSSILWLYHISVHLLCWNHHITWFISYYKASSMCTFARWNLQLTPKQRSASCLKLTVTWWSEHWSVWIRNFQGWKIRCCGIYWSKG